MPPGLQIPDGMIIPPGYEIPESWGVVLYWIGEGIENPWELFSPDWEIGDPLPPTLELPPGIELPSDFNPADHPPEGFLPPYVPPKDLPGKTPSPPLYVEPWSPGPIVGPGGKVSPPAPYGNLLLQTATGNMDYNFGDDSSRVRLAAPITLTRNGRIYAIKIKMGKLGYPLDNIGLKIYVSGLDGKPDILLWNGESSTFWGGLLPEFSPTIAYTTFVFPDKPLLNANTLFFILCVRTSSYDPIDYYADLGSFEDYGNCYYMNEFGTWGAAQPMTIEYQAWGKWA